MLGTEELDSVFVLTPRSEHAHAVHACLRRDVDVFCEKPLDPSRRPNASPISQMGRSRIQMVDFNPPLQCMSQARRPSGRPARPFAWAIAHQPGDVDGRRSSVNNSGKPGFPIPGVPS
jgi:virulence factor